MIAGYSTVYDHGFTFATVKGAGHMVPQYQPQRSLDLFSRWIGANGTVIGALVGVLPDRAAITRQPGHHAEHQSPTQAEPQHDARTGANMHDAPGRNPIGGPRDADEVKALPGWDGPLPSRQYSGYLDIPVESGGKKVNINNNINKQIDSSCCPLRPLRPRTTPFQEKNSY